MTTSEEEFRLLVGTGVAERAFKAGETIFREGDAASELYVIKHGTVDLTSGNRHLATLRDNEIFGEMALIDGHPRSATALAVSDTTLVPVTEKQFLFMVGQTPFFALKVLRVLAHRLRHQNKVL